MAAGRRSRPHTLTGYGGNEIGVRSSSSTVPITVASDELSTSICPGRGAVSPPAMSFSHCSICWTVDPDNATFTEIVSNCGWPGANWWWPGTCWRIFGTAMWSPRIANVLKYGRRLTLSLKFRKSERCTGAKIASAVGLQRRGRGHLDRRYHSAARPMEGTRS
jgi:hypothetical protein